MGKINVLSFEVANLIAAGEVVDRPSSVIKELVENSIDSGATRITVEIQRGGVMFMRVTDNGCGMSPEDLPIAVRRHATSKIKDANDLEGIITLGFRGEALAAISAVSDVRIISKTADRELGAYIEVNSGRIGEVTERGASNGTTVIVENLFANVPARLKFLKRDVTEAMSVCSVVEKIAMSHPEIAFKVISDGVVKLDTAGDGKLFGAIRCVYGKEFAQKLLPVDASHEGVRVYGYITAPVAPRANRGYQNFFINGRYIKTRTGSAAIEQAYTSYIPPEKFPGCVLCIEIAPNVVDVNVHPSKLEVKFSNERPVFDCIYHAVRSALRENSERPGFTAESSTGKNYKTSITSSTAPRVSAAFVPVDDRTATGKDRDRQLNITDNNTVRYSNGSNGIGIGVGNYVAKSVPVSSQSEKNDFWQHISVPGAATSRTEYPKNNEGIKSSAPSADLYGACGISAPNEGIPPALSDADAPPPTQSQKYNTYNDVFSGSSSERDVSEKNISERNFSERVDLSPKTEIEGATDKRFQCAPPALEDNVTERVPDENINDEIVECFGRANGIYRIVGEIFNSYILVEVGDELIVIDKHAAHERLIFEELRKKMTPGEERHTQFLAVPVEIMLMSDEVGAIEQYRQRIEKLGFSFSTARNTVYVNELPVSISTEDVPAIFENFAEGIKNGTGNVELTEEIIFEKALYQASCKAAIKAGRVYPPEYAEWLVKQLFEHPEVTYCPHGRPIALKVEKNYINHRFKRN